MRNPKGLISMLLLGRSDAMQLPRWAKWPPSKSFETPASRTWCGDALLHELLQRRDEGSATRLACWKPHFRSGWAFSGVRSLKQPPLAIVYTAFNAPATSRLRKSPPSPLPFFGGQIRLELGAQQ